ncbi:MAG TPA: 2,3-dihydroxybiphenyl 1,2-dioxygenase, partial [Mycobacterium sp.]|nr:2,3-dihydroxybiphenyl 1,2-dioxygenase [Mycobacterium sp.]
MTDQLIGAHNAHNDLHSEQGARPGEHPGRSANPTIKVHDVLWLEFEKPDLVKAEAFAHSFGFATVLRTKDELQLRGSDAGAPCVLIRRGQREKFLGPAFVAAEQSDLLRLADATGTSVRPLPESLGGVTVDLVDPSGLPVRVVSGTHRLEALPTAQTPHVFNFGHTKVRTNAMQRPPRVPTNVQRLGHIVVQTPKYIEALNWYLDTFGMIVSDFSYYPGQRERGPILSFIRCDRGSVPAD